MDLKRLLRPEKPWLHLLTATPDAVDDLVARLRESPAARLVCRVIRGRKSPTKADFFNEASAALQFPSYFGDNWDAFDECLADLEWLPGDAYVLVFTDANRLLEKEPAEELQTLLELLQDAGEEWARPVEGEGPGPAKPFHSLLQCTKEDEPPLRHKLQAAKVAFQHLK
jgi:RNAse (barnase) inhibitor barstar